MNYFTSDLHLGHRSIIEYCSRPYSSVEEMDEGLIKNWNDLVKPEDTVYVLGDFCLRSSSIELALRLNGTKILVAGNHDEPFRGKKIGRYTDAGFTEIYRRGQFPEIQLEDGRKVRLSHLPYTPHDDRYAEDLPLDDGMALLHGHVHEKWTMKLTQKGTMQLNVGVDVHNFWPISERQVECLLRFPGEHL